MRWRARTLAVIAMLTASAPSVADEGVSAKEVEALRLEVRALKAQLRALSEAASEVAELNKRTAEIWAVALAGEKRETKPKPRSAKKAVKSVAKKRRRRPAAAASVGTVRGSVKVPANEPIAYAYVENVFAPPVRGKKVVIDQKDKRFVPSWAVVRRGTVIEFPNHDNIYHNVFSRSPGNAFDLGLYHSGAPAKEHAFQAAGSADIYCNIHPRMAASVLVVPNGLFAKVKSDGTFVINNVPAGQRKIVAWSPGTQPSTKWVDLGKDATATVELTLERKSGAHLNKMGRPYGSYE